MDERVLDSAVVEEMAVHCACCESRRKVRLSTTRRSVFVSLCGGLGPWM
jgi:hypothetical protein